ncbi:uncharacterized protein CBL_06221 [Carabus blaptoides fortunei]
MPPIINRCKYSTDKVELGECMKKEHERLLDHYMNGFVELHLPKFDPYHLDKMIFGADGNNNAISFTATFHNLNMHGSKNMVIEKLSFDVENGEFEGTSYIPYINIVADYDIKGNILILPLDSTGIGNLNLTNVRTVDKYTGRAYTKNGKRYLTFDKDNCSVNVTMSGFQINIDHLINGNPELTKLANTIMNENSDALIGEMKQIAAGSFMTIRLNILNTLFNTYSIHELFA